MRQNANRPVVLAVSGGIDSVVMLDLAISGRLSGDDFFEGREIVVAHFDHGIRANSHEDTKFVRSLAAKYGLKFASARAELGAGISESVARQARYQFLGSLKGEIWTAHHFGDVLETVAINLIRGTGWRGLAVFGNRGIGRFFVDFHDRLGGFWSKKDVINYALDKGLEWHEDETNTDPKYLRNRVRAVLGKAGNYGELVQEVGQLFWGQRRLADEIDKIVAEIVGAENLDERQVLLSLPEEALAEILRAKLIKSGHAQTRNGITKLVDAIETYQNGKRVNLEGDFLVKIGKNIIF